MSGVGVGHPDDDPPARALRKIRDLETAIDAVLSGGADRDTIKTAVRNWTGVPTDLPDDDAAEDEYQDDPNLSRMANIALRRDEFPPLIVNGRLYPDEPRRAATDQRANEVSAAVLRLLPEASDTEFDALYTLLKVGYRLGQISKSLGKLLFVAPVRGAIGRLLKPGPGHLSRHDASPSLGLDNQSVGEDRPAPAGEVGPGHAESGDA